MTLIVIHHAGSGVDYHIVDHGMWRVPPSFTALGFRLAASVLCGLMLQAEACGLEIEGIIPQPHAYYQIPSVTSLSLGQQVTQPVQLTVNCNRQVATLCLIQQCRSHKHSTSCGMLVCISYSNKDSP